MMKPFQNKIIPFFLLLIFAVTLACNLVTPSGTPTAPDIDAAVAATLTALAPTASETAVQTPAPTATIVQETAPPATTAPETASPTTPEATSPPPPESTDLRVAYLKDGNVWFWTQGSAVALTSSGNVLDMKISEDGLIVAFLRMVDEFHNELWAVNTDGSEERVLVSVTDLDAMSEAFRDPNAKGIVPHHYQWIPGTHTLAFNTRPTFEGAGLILMDDLRLVNADSLEKSTLLPPGEGGEFYFSPDGSQVAVSTPVSISLVNADGSNRRADVLTYEGVLTYSEYQYYAHPIWAPDSTFLRVAIPPADPLAEPRQPTTLWQIPVDGSPATQLGSIISAPFFGSEIAFSPDLNHLIYLRETGEPEENLRELHIANPDGSADTLYHTAPLIQFQGWSPDSTRFIFSMGEERAMQLGQIGEGFVPLTAEAAVIASLRWVDPQRYLFLKDISGAFELRLNSLDGSTTLLDTTSGSLPSYDFDH